MWTPPATSTVSPELATMSASLRRWYAVDGDVPSPPEGDDASTQITTACAAELTQIAAIEVKTVR